VYNERDGMGGELLLSCILEDQRALLDEHDKGVSSFDPRNPEIHHNNTVAEGIPATDPPGGCRHSRVRG